MSKSAQLYRHPQQEGLLDHRTASQLRSGRELGKWVACTSWIVAAAAVVIIILASLLLAEWPPRVTVTCTDTNSSNSSSVVSYQSNDTLCALTTPCLQGFIFEEGARCMYYPRPTSVTNCSSACYSAELGSTQCNGAGECVGDAASCVGTCTDNNYCDDELLFNVNYELVFSLLSPTSNWVPAGWWEAFGCWYGQCVFAILDIFVGSSTEPIFQAGSGLTYNLTALSAHHQCEDYVYPAFIATSGQCLRFSRHLLASEVVGDYFDYGHFAAYGNGTFPFQIGVCVISFACGVSDPNVGIANMSRIPWKRNVETKSRAAWGFHPVTGELAAASSAASLANADNPLQLRDPAARNLFWADTAKWVKGALPKVLAHVEEKTRILVS